MKGEKMGRREERQKAVYSPEERVSQCPRFVTGETRMVEELQSEVDATTAE